MIKGVPEGHPMPSINADYDTWEQERMETERMLEYVKDEVEEEFLEFKRDDTRNIFSINILNKLEDYIYEYDYDFNTTFSDVLYDFSDEVLSDFFKANKM